MGDKSKSWKDYLLQSSLPLEYSVSQILRRLAVSRPEEYRYEKPDENGVLTTFSIDQYGNKSVNNNRFLLELFVECKYRHQNTNWVFTPHEFKWVTSADFKDTFIILDGLCRSWKVNDKLINSFSNSYPLCGKGIEIYSEGFNPKSITQAVSQLQYSLVKKVVEGLDDQVEDFLGNPDRIHILIPIIVTTAKLWRLNPGLTIENIHSAETIAHVAHSDDFLLVHEEPDNALKRFTSKHLMEAFSEEAIQEMDKTLRANKETDYKSYVRRFSQKYPSIFLVVNYDALETRLGNMFRFFEREDVLQTRKTF